MQRHDTLFSSARLNSVFAFPLSGRAPFTLSWEEFVETYFGRMERTGVVKSMKDFYWDIRPKPEYGTIELRVCDTPLSVEVAAALAGYLQVLCAMLQEGAEPEPEETDYLVYNYNRFQACRFGLEGTIVHPKTYEPVVLRNDILATLQALAARSGFGDRAAIDHLALAAEQGSDASYLRTQYKERGSAEGMVDAAIARFRG